MRVGDIIKDGDGNDWLVAASWVRDEWTDYRLIHKETGAEGALRLRIPPSK